METQLRRTAAQLAIMLTAAHRRVTRLRPIPARLRNTCTPQPIQETQQRRTAVQLAIMLTAAHRRVTRLRSIPARLPIMRMQRRRTAMRRLSMKASSPAVSPPVLAMGSQPRRDYAGSRIIGPIALSGSAKVLEFIGGNFLYTLNSLSGVTINTHGAPFVISANSVAVLDPTALALQDRSVMDFTGLVSSALQDPLAAWRSPAGLARSAARWDLRRMLLVAWTPRTSSLPGMPSLAIGYSSEVRNANAADLRMYTKAPAAIAPVYDTMVWSSGFGGERRYWQYEPLQRARDGAFGGALGVDRQVNPALRVGVFAGAGASSLSVDQDIQKVSTDYVFGGGYARYDMRNYYLDVALFGGGLNGKSTAPGIEQSGGEPAWNSLRQTTNGWFISPDATFGYRFFMGDYVVTPERGSAMSAARSTATAKWGPRKV